MLAPLVVLLVVWAVQRWVCLWLAGNATGNVVFAKLEEKDLRDGKDERD